MPGTPAKKLYTLPLLLTFALSAGTTLAEDVQWSHQTNVSASPGALEKTGGCDGCDDAGALSAQEITTGDGYVEFRVDDVAPLLVAGLSEDRRGNIDIDAIDYAIRIQDGRAEVRENNAFRADVPVSNGDMFRIALESGEVHYYHNGTSFHRGTVDPSYPLGFAVTLLGAGAALADAAIIDGEGQDFWRDVVNASASGYSLVKTGGCDGCADAGARSRQEVEEGDIAVEFSVPDVDKTLYVGISNGSGGTGHREIDHAIRVQDGRAEVRENGDYKADTRVSDGAVFRIEVEDGEVRYYADDQILHRSEASPEYPLLLDVSLLSEGAAVEDVSAGDVG